MRPPRPLPGRGARDAWVRRTVTAVWLLCAAGLALGAPACVGGQDTGDTDIRPATVRASLFPSATARPTPVRTSRPIPTATLLSSLGSARFAVKGDWGAGSSAQAAITARMCDWRNITGFADVLTTGDNLYNPDGTATEGNYYIPEECLYAGPSHRWHAAWGNHDYSGSSTQDVLGSPSQPKYFSWTAGDAAFFAYDGTNVTQAQRDWLRSSVCSSAAAVKVIYGQPAPVLHRAARL